MPATVDVLFDEGAVMVVHQLTRGREKIKDEGGQDTAIFEGAFVGK